MPPPGVSPPPQAPREWYYYPEPVKAAPQSAPAVLQQDEAGTTGLTVDETGRAGPVSRVELKQLFSKGGIGWSTRVWAAGAHPGTVAGDRCRRNGWDGRMEGIGGL